MPVFALVRWIDAEHAKRLVAMLDSDQPDRMLVVDRDLRDARHGRRFQVGVSYDEYGAKHPIDESRPEAICAENGGSESP